MISKKELLLLRPGMGICAFGVAFLLLHSAGSLFINKAAILVNE